MNEFKFTLSTALILDEAKKRGIKVMPISSKKIVSLKLGNHEEHLFYQFISKTSSVAHQVCHHKDLARTFFQLAGISVVEGKEFDSNSYDKALSYFEKCKKPVVMKPTSSAHGNHVFVGISTPLEFKKCWLKTKKTFKAILIEEMFYGNEYRIFATKEKVVGITFRVPANVIGDGIHTIKELIKIKNKDPRRGSSYDTALIQIKIDNELKSYLLEQDLSLESILPKDKQVFLRKTSNLSTGGDSIDFTDKVHPSVKKIAIEAVKAIPGLEYGGVDFMTEDVTKAQTKDSYNIIEINASPMISMHHFPYEGKSRDVAKEIVDLAFPETKSN